MAEDLLLRLTAIGAIIGMAALTVKVGKTAHGVWSYFYQRKEPRV